MWRFIFTLPRKVHWIMATLADMQAVTDRIAADLSKLATDVAALQTKVGGIVPADLDPILAKLTDAAAAMEALDASVAPAVPPVEPPAPPVA